MPKPVPLDYAANAANHYVGAFEKLKIDVFGVEDLQREILTDASGSFLFPFVGRVVAAGKTPNEIANMIETQLRGQYIRDPKVTVNIFESTAQIVTIDGEVKRPGSYPLTGKMTLVKAIAAAEGVGQYASLKDVVIFRQVDGKRYAGLYNLDAIRRGQYSDPEIYANDLIVVGDSPGRRLFQDFLQATPLLTTPLIILAQQ
ncbi:MAG: transposase [Cyanobacteria bacterium DS2.008]|uniref:polysaccharide biosynthesis/export family protein n=1 Tax=Blastomonas sp. TaxID=1909299 RepID=UPI001823DB6A|nr:transposase [Cyanobacteria bacterium DS2.008]MBA4778697.1 polysaccharide export protein [Blastomonas sp.]